MYSTSANEVVKRLVLKIWPYLACAIAGLGTYHWAKSLEGTLHSLVVNISAAFFAIPCLYLVYELSKSFSKRRLNKEIFDYGKMQIDREVLSVTNQLQKLIFPYEERNPTLEGVQTLLALDREQLTGLFDEKQYLGFQVLKKWSVVENNLHDILQNPFIIQRFDDDQVITIIRLVKKIRRVEGCLSIEDLFISENEVADGYRVQDGKSLNPKNDKFPDRYLLLRHIEGDKYEVADFGDFERYKLEDLLKWHKVNPDACSILSSSVSDLIEEINRWLQQTGDEFVIDSQMFKIIQSRRVDVQEEAATTD